MTPRLFSVVPELAPRPDAVEPVGEALLDRGIIGADQLAAARLLQSSSKMRVREIVVARGWASHADVAKALADRHGLGYVDLVSDPPEPIETDLSQVELYLKHRLLPWRRIEGLVCYVTAEPDKAADALNALSPMTGLAFFAVSDQPSIDRAALELFGPQLAARAATRTDSRLSVRTLGFARWFALWGLLVGIAGSVMHWPSAVGVLCAVILLMNLATMSVRLLALGASFSGPDVPEHEGAVVLADRRSLPKISILVPLYREAQMLKRLVPALEVLDYPRELMDVKLLLEERDSATRVAAELAPLPAWIQVLTVPDGAPRTKPRAMNAALDFCDGEIIGILDAEDRPDPDQLRAVAGRLGKAPKEVACVQCRLGYFNARENWITRCFEIEYAVWFAVLMRGFQKLGLPIPLGGTSVYFRRSALHDLEGWDAHNVTEDADLGMRLARRGMRCEMLMTTTEEEANCRIMPWVRQRSRWLKGYMLTWLNHMRNPVRLWRDLGPVGFAGLNVLFLGAAIAYLCLPVFWASVALALTGGGSILLDNVPGWAVAPVAVSLLAGQAVMLLCAGVALHRLKAWSMAWVLPTLPLYWTLGAIAAWKALIEIFAAPYYWDKTRHGVTRF